MSISPNVPSPQDSYHYENTGTPRWIAVLFGVLFVALAAMGFFGYTSQSRMSQELAKAEDQNKMLSAQLAQANSSLADLKGHVEVTEQKVHLTQSELAQARSRAESIRKEQVAAAQKLNTQLSEVQKDSEQKIGAVATDLGGAKKDIETTRNDLEATKGKLERAQGDMGVMSGLIAHNHDDLEDLKRKGDRNYYEFTVPKTKTAQRVGPVQVTLNKVDPKKNRYTMTVFVDALRNGGVRRWKESDHRLPLHAEGCRDGRIGDAYSSACNQAVAAFNGIVHNNRNQTRPCSAFWKLNVEQGF